jgi:hypothetical protein
LIIHKEHYNLKYNINCTILATRKKRFEELWILLKSKDRLEFQKSRSRWLAEGDANTGYFHACVKGRRRSNSIVALK